MAALGGETGQKSPEKQAVVSGFGAVAVESLETARGNAAQRQPGPQRDACHPGRAHRSSRRKEQLRIQSRSGRAQGQHPGRTPALCQSQGTGIKAATVSDTPARVSTHLLTLKEERGSFSHESINDF